MEKLNPRIKIVVTGPESSGKTTLATALARHFHAPLAPEFARTYLEYLGRKYTYQDLTTIYTGQNAWEVWFGARANDLLVCDTDWTVIRIWEHYGYGLNRITRHEVPAPDTHYLLCTPDIPWHPDPLREHPAERDVLFQLYCQLLTDLGASFFVVKGSEQERLKIACGIIEKLC